MDSILTPRLALPHAPWHVGVVIPARNEEDTVCDCLSSVMRTLSACETLCKYWIVLVADACEDSTAAVGQRVLGSSGETLRSQAAAAGVARRLGAQAVLRHFAHVPLNRLWLANTDAYPGACGLDQLSA